MEYHAAVREDVQVFHELMWKDVQHLSLNIRASCIEERVWIHICLYLQKGRLEKMVNIELLDVQIEFRKGRQIRDHIANIHWIIEKTREFQEKHLPH